MGPSLMSFLEQMSFPPLTSLSFSVEWDRLGPSGCF